MARIDGTLVPIANEHLTEAGLDAIMTIVSERTPKKREQFFATGDLDTAYLADAVGRFRVKRVPPARLDLVRVSLRADGGPQLREAVTLLGSQT